MYIVWKNFVDFTEWSGFVKFITCEMVCQTIGSVHANTFTKNLSVNTNHTCTVQVISKFPQQNINPIQ